MELVLDTDQSLENACIEGDTLVPGDSYNCYLNVFNDPPLGGYHFAMPGENFSKTGSLEVVPSLGSISMVSADDGYIESNFEKTFTLKNTGETQITNIQVMSSNDNVIGIELAPSSTLAAGVKTNFTVKSTSVTHGSVDINMVFTDIEGSEMQKCF